MVVYRQRYWRTVTRTVTRTHRQRYWKTRKDGVRQRYWKTVRRRVKVKHRQRYWRTVERKPKEVYEYSQYYSKRWKKTGTPEVIGYEVRIQKRILRGADPLDYYPEQKEWDSMRDAFSGLKGQRLREPAKGIRPVDRFTDSRVVASMGPGWDDFVVKAWRKGEWVEL